MGAEAQSPAVFFSLTEEDFEKLPKSTVPEMQRSNLAPVILQLKALGIDNVLRFPFLSVSPSLWRLPAFLGLKGDQGMAWG